MDLELTDEQTMLGEALTTLLEREWLPAETAHTATPEQRSHLWDALHEFFGDAELGAVELCVAARLFGAHLASTPISACASCTCTSGSSRRPCTAASWTARSSQVRSLT